MQNSSLLSLLEDAKLRDIAFNDANIDNLVVRHSELLDFFYFKFTLSDYKVNSNDNIPHSEEQYGLSIMNIIDIGDSMKLCV